MSWDRGEDEGPEGSPNRLDDGLPLLDRNGPFLLLQREQAVAPFPFPPQWERGFGGREMEAEGQPAGSPLLL